MCNCLTYLYELHCERGLSDASRPQHDDLVLPHPGVEGAALGYLTLKGEREMKPY